MAQCVYGLKDAVKSKRREDLTESDYNNGKTHWTNLFDGEKDCTDIDEKEQWRINRIMFHHLLVEEDGKLVGVISDQDLTVKIASYTVKNNPLNYNEVTENIRVADVMSTDLQMIDSETPIDTASILLLENNISCLPIVNAKMAIEGIVTWKDFMNHFVYR
jgi:acetoin utilization protein AcuB